MREAEAGELRGGVGRTGQGEQQEGRVEQSSGQSSPACHAFRLAGGVLGLCA